MLEKIWSKAKTMPVYVERLFLAADDQEEVAAVLKDLDLLQLYSLREQVSQAFARPESARNSIITKGLAQKLS